MLAGCCLGAFAQNAYDDDIYYDPRRDTSNKQTKRNSNYIRNMADMDVDAYNRRGQYYPTPVDTIGEATGNAEDFVYTQQIQKYYNPTIARRYPRQFLWQCGCGDQQCRRPGFRSMELQSLLL